MRFIGYEELEPGHNFPLLKDSLEENPYPHKENIIHFLRSGTIELTGMSAVKDIFTGKAIPAGSHIMSHGDYVWGSDLAWYVEKYNLRLPKDFEDYILENMQDRTREKHRD